jgi:hypothetical protein
VIRRRLGLPRAGNYTLGVLLLLGMILCIALGLQAQSRLASGLWFVAALLMLPPLIARAIQDDVTAGFNRDVQDPGSAPSLRPESNFVVTVDDRRIVCRHPSGDEKAVAWDDLDTVVIETNDTGPWGADVWWLLLGRDGSHCAIPQGASGEAALLDRLQALPGFDNTPFIAAMGCTENRRFLCWRRPQNPPAQQA